MSRFYLLRFGYVGSLRTLLPLHDLELDFVAFLKTLIPFGSDGAVVNEDIRTLISADESVALRVVEPLHGSFQTFHVPPSFALSPERCNIPEGLAIVVRIVLPRQGTVKDVRHTMAALNSEPDKSGTRWHDGYNRRLPDREPENHRMDAMVLASRIRPERAIFSARVKGKNRIAILSSSSGWAGPASSPSAR